MIYFAALVEETGELEEDADLEAEHADREACLAVLELHICQLSRHVSCPRGLQERALLLLHSLLTIARIQCTGPSKPIPDRLLRLLLKKCT